VGDTAISTDLRAAESLGGGQTSLHYTARAGLLAELSRQTYDSLYKALREAILNGIDAGATAILLDFGDGVGTDEVLLEDDGEGMDLDGLREAFMSLGGSAKYDDDSKFGRIGIGSLALLTYGEEATIETKRAKAETVVKAHLFHPQTLDREQRTQELQDFAAGIASEERYDGSLEDHFTRIRLRGLTVEVRAVVDDPAAYYGLLDQLRRVLPLPLGDSRLFRALEREDPDLVDLLRSHAEQWSVPIRVSSAYHEPTELTRRTYGDGPDEIWAGKLRPIHKTIRLVRPGERRNVVVAGFFANQKKAVPVWSGLTARVQNVAVEERTFFDVEADPGFRKYISGEVFLLGDVDTDRLININRTSFNRESKDYIAVQRFLGPEIESFKRKGIADLQRQKVDLRRAVERYRTLLAAVDTVLERATELVGQAGENGLPSSKNGTLRGSEAIDPVGHFRSVGANVTVSDEGLPTCGYRLEMPEDKSRLKLILGSNLAKPSVLVGQSGYKLVFRRGSATQPCVIVKNRPREIVFNLQHPAIGGDFNASRTALALALELSYILPRDDDADGLYEQLLGFVATL